MSRFDLGGAPGMNSALGPLKIATTWEGRDADHLARVLPHIDCLEVTTDDMEMVVGGRRALHPSIALLEEAAHEVDVVFHGIGLSLCSHEGMHQPYIDLLDKLLDRIEPLWHSEHLGYVRVDGAFVGTMLRPPKTRAAAVMVSDRIKWLQDRYGIPFLLEHVVGILPDPPGEYTDAAFLNAIIEMSDCGLILDVYNLQCDAHNHGLDIDSFLDVLNLAAVRELHTARGQMVDGMQLDAHALPLTPDTIELARRVVPRCPNLEVITYEILSSAVRVIGIDAVVDEVKQLETLFGSSSWSSEICNASSTA